MSKNDRILLQEGESFEKKSLFWEASQKYQEALLRLNTGKGNKDKKSFCKRKIREMNALKAKGFLVESFEIKLSRLELEDAEKYLEWLKGESAGIALSDIGESDRFNPSYAVIAEDAKNLPIAFQITNLDMQDVAGNFVRGGHDPYLSYRSSLYRVEQIKKLYCLLVPTLSGYLESREDSYQDLYEYFVSKKFLSDDSLYILSTGLRCYCESDFVSAIHVLISSFEGVFFEMMSKIEDGPDLIKGRIQKGAKEKIWTQDKILGEDLMLLKETRALLGDDFCEHVVFSYFSQLGNTLRHKLAHGKLKGKDYNIYNATLALYFLLALVSRIKNTSSKEAF